MRGGERGMTYIEEIMTKLAKNTNFICLCTMMIIKRDKQGSIKHSNRYFDMGCRRSKRINKNPYLDFLLER